MSRKVIEIVQVLVDRIEKGGYQQRAREENAFDLNKRLTEAEGWVAHWKQARQEAHEAGELMRAEIETLRKELADANRAASDEFVERQVLTVEQQQDAAAWQQELDAARAEIETLKGAMSADDQRLRDAEQRIWPLRTLGRGAPDAMADEILHLRGAMAADDKRLRDAEEKVWPGVTLGCDAAEKMADEILYLRQQLDAANAAVTLQRAGIERLQAFVAEVRQARDDYQWPDSWDAILGALADLDDEPTEPTPVAARCPECDESGMVDSGGFGPDGKGISVPCGGDCRGNQCPSQPATVAEPVPCPKCEPLQAEIERLQAFVETVRKWNRSYKFQAVIQALAELDEDTQPTPVAEPIDGEGGQ